MLVIDVIIDDGRRRGKVIDRIHFRRGCWRPFVTTAAAAAAAAIRFVMTRGNISRDVDSERGAQGRRRRRSRFLVIDSIHMGCVFLQLLLRLLLLMLLRWRLLLLLLMLLVGRCGPSFR